MQLNPQNLLAQLVSSEADERMRGLRHIRDELDKGNSELTSDLIQVLGRIAESDPNVIVKSEASRIRLQLGYPEFEPQPEAISLPNNLQQAVEYPHRKIPRLFRFETVRLIVILLSLLLGFVFCSMMALLLMSVSQGYETTAMDIIFFLLFIYFVLYCLSFWLFVKKPMIR